LKKAIQLYTQALDIPSSSKHLLYSNRSGTYLALGKADQALEDAQLAVQHAPPHFTTASVRLADALYALGRVEEAVEAMDQAAQRWPAYKNENEYKQLIGELMKQLKRAR
jgi:tetratricopeptide (TPR) repeat protein